MELKNSHLHQSEATPRSLLNAGESVNSRPEGDRLARSNSPEGDEVINIRVQVALPAFKSEQHHRSEESGLMRL